ncbi:hypothetical protein [Sphingomonas colocasiae]|uniref:Uncharacterized protein n=1 Tax=Sphingomonas colocasiae TaxID=1848973 RepID=A0ABS7PPD3_9SPHN|nr:hypothetical protein [Sphingomonas colocasiae]MBY8823179.1 hypothetical protein [Sphingomonas colocasiae]
MRKPKLLQQDKLTIRGLNRANVELTVAGLKPFLERSKWIGSTNHYGKDVVRRLKAGVPGTPERKRHLAQYIAASVALHANDGWSYLGRAIACILAGDTHRALHLAYYAELRAAMSLLASAGVGVFDKQHYVISGTNSTSKLRAQNGTHIMAWLALEEWSRRPASGALFSSLVRPEGLTLDEWFHPQGGASSLAPQAKAWFMQWGMDLGLASKDREARNESSYRPDGVPTTWEVGSKDGLEFVRDMWSALEPSSASSFEQIDRHILRLAVERHHFSVTNRQASAADATYVALVNGIVEAQSLATATEQRLKSFLLRQSAPTDPQIFRCSAIKPGNPQSDAFAVMARAVLLLRIATGAAHLLLNRAGFDANLLGFWWQKLGEARGLWRPGAAPAALTDLWADVEESLRDVADMEASSPEALDSFHAMSAELPGSLNMLASHERVSLWGLCPA